MVYVDKPTHYLREQTNPFAQRYGSHVKWCHLFADSLQELHDFASKLELKPSWFQDKKRFPHYDIVQSKRQQAIALGAQEIDLRNYLKNKLGYN
jgi:hypothetical protein